MLRRYLSWLCLGMFMMWAPAAAQTVDAFAVSDSALAAGDLDAAQQQIQAILASAHEPAVIGGGVLRLSQIAQLRGDLPAAEMPLRDSLKRLPAGDPAAQPALAAIYIQLGAVAMARGEMSRAQLALMKGIAIGRQVAPDDPQLLEAELTLATAEIRAFRLDDAARRLADIDTRIQGKEPRLAALWQSVSGELAFRRYDYTAAIATQQKARDLFAALYGDNHAETARAETALGSGLFNAGHYREAAAMLQHAVAVYDRDTQFYGPALAAALINLGQIYYTTGRSALAVTALDRAVTLSRESAGPGNQTEAAALLHRGYAKLRQNDLASATTDLEAAKAIWSAPATTNRRAVAGADVWLAEAQRRAGQLSAADTSLSQSAAILTEIFGPESYAMSDVLAGRGELAMARKDPEQAIELYSHALKIRTGAVGPDHIASLDIRSALAMALAENGDLTTALSMIAEVSQIVRQRIALQAAAEGGASLDDVEASRRLFGRHVAILALARQASSDDAKLIAESVAVGQWARASAAGQAIADLGTREALAQGPAAESLRAMQEAVLQWQMAERGMTARVAAAEAREDLSAAQAEVERLRVAADKAVEDFDRSYPVEAQFRTGTQPSVTDLQHALRPQEVLLSYLTLEDRSFLWVLSAKRADLVPIEHNDFWLGERIRRLRATVNPKEVSDLSDILPFATDAAAELYDALIAPARLTADESHLIIVPDGTLQSLPFAALLSSHAAPPDDFSGYRDLPWLIRERDIAILPEMGALAVLRQSIRPSAAKEPFLGIGDPLLPGAEMPATDAPTTAELLRSLSPLPEAADELAALADSLKAPPKSVVTSTLATEAAVKSMPLQDYRVIAFATHGLVAGDFGRLREPGLVLTPPATADGENDGLLTPAEIARLKLDADWIILSACNTAAADGTPGAEGLSGLARGFFFAGSRALLVSQWEVLSVAAVQLTSGTLQHLAKTPQIGKAAALRSSILDLMSAEQDDYLAHPIFWAPFELVGEGGALP